jgi:hypothetical protein
VRAHDDVASDVSDVDFVIRPRVIVTAPNAPVTWAAGTTRTITWNHNLGPADTVDIAMSPDGGASWIVIASRIASATSTTGTWTGRLPSILTTQALVRVSWSSDPGESDVSDAVFTLLPPAITVTAPNTNVAWQTGEVHTIRWSHNLGTSETVRIELTRDGGLSWQPIADSVPNTAAGSGAFAWLVSGPSTTRAAVRVTWTVDQSVTDAGDVSFRIPF